MLVRHGKKGNGENPSENKDFGGNKNLLCAAGEIASMMLRLPKTLKGEPIGFVGGSQYSRSLMTALRIANSHQYDPIILASDSGLGSRKDFEWFTQNWDQFTTTVKECNNIEIAAVRKMMDPMMVEEIASNIMTSVAMAMLNLDEEEVIGNVILGTHSPWIQIAIERITGELVNYNAAELSYIVIELVSGKRRITATNIPELATQLGIRIEGLI